jgi:high-affinity iron transporter
MRVVRETKAGVDNAVVLAEAGEGRAAAQAALDAYLLFERIESGVRAKDAAAARRVERAFAELRGVLQRPDEAARVAMVRAEVYEALDLAGESLTIRASAPVLFGQSFVIILREGLEALLIIGALMAFLTKAGAVERRRDIVMGVWVAIGASVVTAVAFGTIFQTATAQQEVIEGMTMLLASFVLFWVSYWLISKIELRKWHEFVHNQMRSALAKRGAWALGGVAFLAVYREGFETVLFYAALFTSSDGSFAAMSSIAGGVVAGGLVLAVVYFLMQRYGLRLPLKPFFAITSGFLYVMAFSFAGQGVAELQEIGWIPTTTWDWIPSVPALGVFPTMQTVMSQVLLAVALIGALAWVFWIEPRAARVRAS